jgi:hypothetical protein
MQNILAIVFVEVGFYGDAWSAGYTVFCFFMRSVFSDTPDAAALSCPAPASVQCFADSILRAR